MFSSPACNFDIYRAGISPSFLEHTAKVGTVLPEGMRQCYPFAYCLHPGGSSDVYSPERARRRIEMARVYGTSSVEEALGYLRKVCAVNPNDPFTLHAIGRQLYTIGEYEDARSYFQSAEDVKNGFSASNLYYLGSCLHKTGNSDTSIDCLKKALTLPARNTVDRKGKAAARKLLCVIGVHEDEIAAIERADSTDGTQRVARPSS
uniref:TPR_REGION domain-containing protein n=1 Tax=Steinernema glaseri TaxID=37863 RepID=A0A1I7ZZ57_9BILA